ncbi:MAG: preprotein translocase subunit YajC [Verrucomicrobiota bacterium]
MTQLFTILAQDAPPGPNPLQSFLPIILIFVAMYFILIRPQRKKQKETEAMVAAMKTGDQVVTAGGIHGIVMGVSKTTAAIKVCEGTKIVFEKSSITRVVKKGKGNEEETVEAEAEVVGEKKK